MKKLFIYFVFFLLFPSLSFSDEYEKALKRSAEESKPLVLYFFVPYCPYCQRMDNEVLLDKDIKALLEKKLVFVRINAEKKWDLARDYGILGYPTTCFLEPSGKGIGCIPGAIPKKTFRKILDYLTKKTYNTIPLYDFLMRE